MNQISQNNINDFLSTLNFKRKDGEEDTYFKQYNNHNNYELTIIIDNDFKKSRIDYGDKIKINRQITFSQQENFVTLECIDRLLEKGYPPDKIHLEKDWQLGHREKGRLDIQILDQDNKSFLMIECKTYEKEFEKEENKMYENGGQLFSYYVQDKETKYLCLYSSQFENFQITYSNNIIKIDEKIKNSNNQTEAFENWKPQIFEKNGIFEKDIKPYFVEFKGRKKGGLTDLTQRDGSKIFNRFAEILRRNVISDKTNAYNKIFNLFLCKIVDEYETSETDFLKFQWKENEKNEDALLRLNELYKRGMEHYLGLKISAVDIKDFEDKINQIRDEDDKKKIKQLFIQQKLYSSNDFAFKEVFDKNTFDLNCEVVKEVVKLLEIYKIKYETKQQFLGDFFEKLLNTGIKQEVGQFFTPVPIAQFICKCLPIEKIIKDKIKDENEIYVLPYLIDYASGAGHFITEGMEEINNIIQKIDERKFKNQRALQEFKGVKKNFDFAQKYIYGIEKDYRLAKTTKVATYLNGDGDAQIVLGDGLDHFYKSKDYAEKPRLKLNENKKDNKNFDIVIANPPYSVSGFKNTLNYGKDSFELFDHFTDKSKEIECLFIERTKQLLNSKYGVAGILLPNSILTNSGIYSFTRDLILNHFEIKGIVEFGSNTFMATGINTIVLFLKKIENKTKDILHYLNKSINEKRDNSINNIEKPIHRFLKNSYQINFNTYLKFFENNDTENKELKQIGIYNEYIKQFQKQKKSKELNKFVTEKEIDKLKTFILTYNKKVVISNIPTDHKEEKRFLGYEFSNRRGYEGINVFDEGGSLYNPHSLQDKTKVNTYILQNFLDEKINEIDPEVTTIKILDLHQCINFKSPIFEKVINLQIRKEFNSQYPLKDIGEIFNQEDSLKNGVNVNQEDDPSKYKVSRIETIYNKKLNLNKVKYTNDEVDEKDFLKNGDILMSHINSLEHIGKSAFVENLNEKIIHGINTLKFRNHNKNILSKYIYLLFQYPLFINLLKTYSKKAVHQASITITDIKNIKIPIPPKEIQETIIKENEELEKEDENLLEENKKLNEAINKELNFIKQRKDIEYREIQEVLSDNIKTGATPFTKDIEYWKKGDINWLNIKDMNVKYIKHTSQKITKKGLESKKMEIFKKGTVLFSIYASLGKIGIIEKPCALNQAICSLSPNVNILSSEYLYYILKLEKENIRNLKIYRTQENLNSTKLKTYKIPVIKDLKEQNQLINKILELENKISNNKKKLQSLKQNKNKIIEKYLLEE